MTPRFPFASLQWYRQIVPWSVWVILSWVIVIHGYLFPLFCIILSSFRHYCRGFFYELILRTEIWSSKPLHFYEPKIANQDFDRVKRRQPQIFLQLVSWEAETNPDGQTWFLAFHPWQTFDNWTQLAPNTAKETSLVGFWTPTRCIEIEIPFDVLHLEAWKLFIFTNPFYEPGHIEKLFIFTNELELENPKSLLRPVRKKQTLQ